MQYYCSESDKVLSVYPSQKFLARCLTFEFSRSQEVGESSKLARSFERVRSIIRKRRQKSFPESGDSQQNVKLDELVVHMMKNRKKDSPIANTTFIEQATIEVTR